ncbi:MAG: endonuclease [Bacteroidetes bacterium]|nr:endonuclease [Bacteroidota bacterium]
MKKVFLLFICSISILNAQIFTSKSQVVFPQVKTGMRDSSQIFIENNSSLPVDVKLFKKSSSVFLIRDTLFTIPSNEKHSLQIYYSPSQNVIDKDVLIFQSVDRLHSAAIALQGSGKYGDMYDASTFNLFDNDLKSALTDLVKNHTALGYNTGRDRMFDTIDKRSGDTIECVYTGRKVKAANRTAAQNQNFNTEHTWPQSNFNQAEPMKSDIFHLFPTDVDANSRRSNYPFGKVVSGQTWSVGGSKLGNDSYGSQVFEPRDKHKGFAARSVLYFQIRYPNNYGNYLKSSQEEVMREWNKSFSVTSIETARNSSIAVYQKNRNPFIDHPEFVDRIYSFIFSTVSPKNPEMDLSLSEIYFDSTFVGDTSQVYLHVVNYGKADLSFTSVSNSNKKNFSYSTIASVKSKEFISIKLIFSPDLSGEIHDTLKIVSNAGSKSIPIKGVGILTNSIEEQTELLADEFELYQNYPNPFNPKTVIRFHIPSSKFIKLQVYDILGREVQTLVDEVKSAGIYEVMFNSSILPSGTYYYKLTSGSYQIVKKMMILK